MSSTDLFFINVYLICIEQDCGKSKGGKRQGILAEVDSMSQVSCQLPSCLYISRLWFDPCFRAVLQVHADWGLSVAPFCEIPGVGTRGPLWTTSSLKKKKKVCLSFKQKLHLLSEQEETSECHTVSSVQMEILRFTKLRNILKETSWINNQRGIKTRVSWFIWWSPLDLPEVVLAFVLLFTGIHSFFSLLNPWFYSLLFGSVMVLIFSIEHHACAG